MRKYLHEILALLGPDKSRLPRLLLLFLAASMLDIAGIGLIGPYVAIVAEPQLAESTIDQFNAWVDLPTSPEFLLTLMSLVLLGVFLVKAVSAIWINYIVINFSIDQQVRLRTHLMKSYQSLPYTTYLNRNSSEYIHSTQTLVNHYANGVVLSGMKSLSDGVVAMVILVFLAWTNPWAFALLAGLLVIVVLGYDIFFRKNINKLGRKANNAATKMVQGLHEGLEGLKEIRILGHEKFFYDQVHQGADKYGYYHARSAIISAAPRYLLELVMVLFLVSLVLLTLVLDQNSQNLLSTLGMFGLAAIRLLPTANVISSSLIRFRFYRDSVSRLYGDVIDVQRIGLVSSLKRPNCPEVFNLLSMRDVTFRYPSAKQDALKQLTLDICAGDSIGLIGSSGSGKTTLVDVLLGLLIPQKGEVLYNGNRLDDNLGAWYSHVAYIPQQVFLSDNTLRNNVALGVNDEDIDERKVVSALQMAKLSELVQQLPDGIETVLGERGVRLSGGQKQRVALARAFYHDRDVLIMDEATSALDDETEREITGEIERLKGKTTLIVIAHRLSTVRQCDRIYKIENGSVVSQGAPSEMLP